MKGISVVIPTLNEEGNIEALCERLARAFDINQMPYELIFVDDHSTDNTCEVVKKILHNYPISLYLKSGQKGKARSLIEGFREAHYDIVAMIDADLQYPPEAIPAMVRMVESHEADIVVANRAEHNTDAIRKFVSKAFHFIFAKVLHNLDVDTQSGLKVFRKEIFERIRLNPSPWAFDMEFLLKARHAGYSIGGVDIIFEERHAGETKVNILKASYEIGLSALQLKLQRFNPIPFHSQVIRKKGFGFHHYGAPFTSHTNLHHNESALYRMSRGQVMLITGILLVFGIGLTLNWYWTLITFIGALTLLYFTDLVFNLFLIVRSFTRSPEIKISDEEISSVPDNAWPTYTIFCPLYREWQVLPQFVTAMSRLDYPQEKLQIMLLLEEDDVETIRHARSYKLPKNFEIVVVPHALPKTKPKACNYGLIHATGDFSVIYDAEDVPDGDQLKKAVLAFQKAGPNVVCVQAKLNFYNSHQNILTRIFAAEYSLWFDLVLTGIQSIDAPIPLGGTSNHFRTDDLVELKGWDAFNVTEDCDLGMRLVKRGFKTAMVDSMTMEEGTSRYKNWFRQRSRWIKGYIQTYFVHMRNPGAFKQSRKEPHLVAFQFIVGGKILSMFINPVMWIVTFVYFAFRSTAGPIIEQFFPTPILIMGVVSFVFGNFLYLYYYMIACAKRGHDDLIKYVFFVPFYWLSMSGAAWMAVYEMIVRPHYWQKTVHGFHLTHNKAKTQARQVIGKDLVDKRLTETGI